MEDIRDILFSQVSRSRITACIFSDGDGVLSGVELAAAKAAELGLTVNYAACEGAALMAGDLVMELCGPPKAIAQAEDNLMGLMLKPSGIATAAARFVRAAGDMRIVCGSWKKLPHEIKPLIRDAVTAGGAGVRICEEPMVYLDKNYVEMLGGIQSSLRAAEQLGDRKKVIQIRGKYENGDIVREAFSAVSAGADIVFVDTGRLSDIRKVCEVLLPALRSWKEEFGYRDVKLAYAGGVSFEQLEELRGLGVDIVGVGRAIIDAPLLDMHSMMLRDLIEDRTIEVITGHKLVAVTDSGAELESVANGEKKTVSADTTVISVGLKPNPIDVSEFYGLGAQVYKIGSAKKAGNVIDAVGEAFEVVYNLD